MITSGQKKRRFFIFCAAALGVGVAIVFASFMFLSPDKISSSSSLKASTDVAGKAGGQGSEAYNTKVKVHDELQANEALQQGNSFIPTPIGTQASVIMKDTKEPTGKNKPATKSVYVEPTKSKNIAPATLDNERLKRMMADLKTIDSTFAASVDIGKIGYLKDFEKEKNISNTPTAYLEKMNDSTELNIKAGTLLYAIIDTAVNSDIPSAVMATVVVGEYKDMKLLGKFQRFEERLVLAFSRGILKSGQDVQLEGYAIDPKTTESSVASAVNTHFFSRWGGLIASSFLAGFGEAKQYSGATSSYDNFGGNTDQMVFSNYSLQDQLWIAAGKVGEKASDIFAKNFERVPTVYLDSGSAIGVLILNAK